MTQRISRSSTFERVEMYKGVMDRLTPFVQLYHHPQSNILAN
jgi:hypothetical protein